MNENYTIQDWAGNLIEPDKSFKTFDDAWDFIRKELTNRLNLQDEDYQEYVVLGEFESGLLIS